MSIARAGAPTVALAFDCRNQLGEGPVWSAEQQALYWVDIERAQLWRYTPESGESHSWPLPERPGAIAFRRGGGLVVAFASGFGFYDPETGRRTMIAEIERDRPSTRLNDGACDRQGRFLAGSMDEAEPCEPVAGLYRLERDLSVTHLIDGVRCSNSLCFSPDGRTMYFACSLEREIRAYDYEPETGALSHRRVFCRLDDQPGLPDGSTVDAEGCLWNAQWGAKRVVRYRPNGRIDGIIEIPALNPTCVAFGGRDLDTLFVTTARQGMAPEQIARYPASGGLFAARPGCRGLPAPSFAG